MIFFIGNSLSFLNVCDICDDEMEWDNAFIVIGYFDPIRIIKRIAKASKWKSLSESDGKISILTSNVCNIKTRT